MLCHLTIKHCAIISDALKDYAKNCQEINPDDQDPEIKDTEDTAAALGEYFTAITNLLYEEGRANDTK